jgi:nucleoside-diphosphate-sugar epimerase
MSKTVLITGMGLLGTRVWDKLWVNHSQNDYKIYGVTRNLGETNEPGLIECDLTHGYHVKEVIDVIRPDVILHLAATQASDSLCFENNILSVRNLSHYAPEGCHVVFASSSTVYGDNSLKLSEKYINTEMSPLNPTSVYGQSKSRSESILWEKSLGRYNLSVLRPCAIVSPESPKGVLRAISNKVKRKIAQNDNSPLTLLSNSVKPFVHVDDVADAFIWAIDNPGTYNICGEGSLSVQQLANIVMEYYEYHYEVVFDEESNMAGDNPLVLMSNDKICSGGFQPNWFFSYDAVYSAIRSLVNG